MRGTNMFRNSEGMVIVLPSYPSVTLSWQPSREVACVQGAWSSMSSSSSSAACTESKRSCCRMTWLRPRQPRTARLSSDLMMRIAAIHGCNNLPTQEQHRDSATCSRVPDERHDAACRHQVEQASCPSHAPSTWMSCSRATSKIVFPTYCPGASFAGWQGRICAKTRSRPRGQCRPESICHALTLACTVVELSDPRGCPTNVIGTRFPPRRKPRLKRDRPRLALDSALPAANAGERTKRQSRARGAGFILTALHTRPRCIACAKN